MTLGLEEAARSFGRPVEVALAMELRNPIRAIYDANFPSLVQDRRTDVTERFDGDVGSRVTFNERVSIRDVGEVDILVGGPPCQGHSNLNNHTRRADPKNALYLRMIRAAEVLRPRAIVIENVRDVRHDSAGVVCQAHAALERMNYRVTEVVLSAVRLGVPQVRTRHLLICVAGPAFVDPGGLAAFEVGRPRSLRWAIGDLASGGAGAVFDTPGVLSRENERRARHLAEFDLYDLPNRLRPPCHRDKPQHRYKSMYGRLRWDEPAQTITTGFGSPGQGRYLHPSRLSTLTPHEAARIQFFPDWFDFSSANHRSVLAESIGNAVPSKILFCVGRLIVAAFEQQAEVQGAGRARD